MTLQQKRALKLLRQQEIMNAVKDGNRDLTAEERAELETLQREIEDLDVKSAAEENPQGDPQPQADTRSTEELAEIADLCRAFGLDAGTYIRNATISADQVRADIIKEMIKNNPPIGARGSADLTITASEEDKYRNAVVDGMLLRGGVEVDKPAEGANQFRNMSLRDIAIDALQKEGEKNLLYKGNDELFSMLMRAYFNPSAAFPIIMDNAIQKAYVEGHKKAPVTFDKIVKKGSLNDFKVHDNNYLDGPVGEFFEVPENGEIKHDTFKDEKRPTRQLRTYAKQFTMSRQAFINDDIGVLTSVPARYAAAARKTQNLQVYRIMVNNPAVYDGLPLFSKAHRNILAQGTGITRESMQVMIMALQSQLNEFDEAIIINPAQIVVPSGYAFDIYSIFYSPTIHTEGNTQSVNPLYRYKEMIEVIEDPTINVLCGGFGKQMPWWLLGSKSDTDFIEVDYLNAQEIPTIRRMETAGQLGFVWDIYLDWGISVMDYRGAIKNPGIVVENPLGY